MEVNGQPGEKWASGWHNDKGAGDVQDNAEAGNESYWTESYYKFTKFFPKIIWKIKWKASCKYHGKQTWIKIKYFEESKSNVNTI